MRKPWDHAIELVPDAKPGNCKVYPLAPNEQKELDDFILENLRTGRIRPSKSPMASPVFFMKKDGGLRLIQDYCALNVMMIKNHYSHSSPTLSTNFEVRSSSPSWMFDGVTRMFA